MKWWDRMPWSSFSECWTLSQLRHLQISVKTVMYHYGMISSQLSQLSGSQQDQLDGLDRVVVSSNEIVDTKVLHKSHISLNTNHVWHWGFGTAVFRAGKPLQSISAYMSSRIPANYPHLSGRRGGFLFKCSQQNSVLCQNWGCFKILKLKTLLFTFIGCCPENGSDNGNEKILNHGAGCPFHFYR